MFWKINSKEYKELYHEIEIIKIDIAMLQKRKLRKLPASNNPTTSDGKNKIDDGLDDLREIYKEQNP